MAKKRKDFARMRAYADLVEFAARNAIGCQRIGNIERADFYRCMARQYSRFAFRLAARWAA